MKIGNREFQCSSKTYVMGILNITPDSFSDGGRWNSVDQALAHTEKMIDEGADMIDIGGESTRPGYIQIPEKEEINRVVPVIKAIKERFDIPISIDSYKPAVVKASLEEGVDLVNDIWGLKSDPAMADIIAAADVPCCLMHNRKEPVYHNYLADVVSDLRETLVIADNAGIKRENIILDPGIGFGKTYEQNLILINYLECLRHELGCPVLLGTSRKSVIGMTLHLPADQREEGTIATTVMGVMKGCMFVRVHNVEANVRAIRMTEAILFAKEQTA